MGLPKGRLQAASPSAWHYRPVHVQQAPQPPTTAQRANMGSCSAHHNQDHIPDIGKVPGHCSRMPVFEWHAAMVASPQLTTTRALLGYNLPIILHKPARRQPMEGAASVCTHQGTAPVTCAQAACMTEHNQQQLLLLPPVHPWTVPEVSPCQQSLSASPAAPVGDPAMAAVAAITIYCSSDH
jgi:hypothetical protein